MLISEGCKGLGGGRRLQIVDLYQNVLNEVIGKMESVVDLDYVVGRPKGLKQALYESGLLLEEINTAA